MLIAEGMVTAGVDRSHNVVIGYFSKNQCHIIFFFISGQGSYPLLSRSGVALLQERNPAKKFLQEGLSVQRMHNLYLEEQEPEVLQRQQVILR